MTEKLSRCLRLLAVGLLLSPLLFLFTPPYVRAEAAIAPEACSCPRVVDKNGNPLIIPPGKQPVLLVHGFGFPDSGLPLALPYGTPAQWNGTGGLADELENNKQYNSDYVVGRLDYSDLHDKWVTDAGPDGKSIAQVTAAAIKCMAKNTGKKVIAVGHSMGGLAIQAALGKDPNAAESVAGIVSIGTPWKGVPRERIDAMIKFAMNGLQLGGGALPSWLANHAEDYIKQIQNSSALKALELDSNGRPSEQIQSLPLIKSGIPVLPVAGVVTAIQSDQLKTQTIPLSGLSTGQQVNLTGTTVSVFDNQKAATIATDSESSAGADPFVGVDSALYPNAVGPIWASQPFQCAGNGFTCWANSQHVIGDYHSALPSDPAVAQKVLPVLAEWRPNADKAVIDKLAKDPDALGQCSSPPTPVLTPEPPVVSTPQSSDPPKIIIPPKNLGPVVIPPPILVPQTGTGFIPPYDGSKQKRCGGGQCYNAEKDCLDGQTHGTHGRCNGIPEKVQNGSGSNDSCPNGMIRISPETDTNSGCVLLSGKQEHPKKQGRENPQNEGHRNGQRQGYPQRQGHQQQDNRPGAS